MRTLSLSLLMLSITACSSNTISSQNPTLTNSNKCPEQPTSMLQSRNVRQITLPAKLSDTASQEKQLGYTFEAQTGEKLSLRNIDDLCIWIYSPDNQLLSITKDLTLPKTGKYTLQIAYTNGSKQFNIDLDRANLASPLSSLPPTKDYPEFLRSNYPKASCGDALPTNPQSYPINFYPVELPYSTSNLSKVRISFCQDAFQKTTDGLKRIQIASFTNKEKAQAFVNLISSEINGAKIGTSTTRIWDRNQ